MQKTMTFNSHIPDRESKLTSLLKKSIGGNSYSLLIACVTPIDMYLEETISTLEYASRTSYIINSPIQNEDPKLKIIFTL